MQDHQPKTASTQHRDTPEASPHSWDSPNPEPEIPEDELDDEPRSQSSSMMATIVAAASFSIVLFCGTFYLLTRPCVLGACKALAQAEQLSNTSAQILDNPQSGQEVFRAQQQLNDAIALLESIPPWSKGRGKAQALLDEYQTQGNQLDTLVTAMKTAARASYSSQNPPHTASKWADIQGQWREAIALLETLPEDSELQPLGRQKRKEYTANLEQINQRLLQEQQALKDIKAAEEAAQIAEARQGVAQSLSDWQLVNTTWQTATQRLEQIPETTTAYKEAQRLSNVYSPKMARVRDRLTQEQIAADVYEEGLNQAQQAKTAQANNDWSTAVSYWREAVDRLRQVARDTFYYSKAQTLVESYRDSLQQAQTKAQSMAEVQRALNNLSLTCSGTPQICSYSVDNNVIQVRLTDAYTQQLQVAASEAEASGNSMAKAGVANHVARLEEAFKVISTSARIPLEVYGADGSLIQSHRPGTL